jgi:hypothetical protein
MSDLPFRITSMEVGGPATSQALLDDLDEAAAVMSAASARALRTVAMVDERKLWRRDGATSMTSWLAGRYRLGWGTAREWVRVALALRRLPRIAQAYARGHLSWDQLRPLTRFASPDTDRRWAEKASELRPASLWREARRHEGVRVREAEETRRERYVALDWDHERSVLWLEGMLPAEEGTAFQAAIRGRAEKIPADHHRLIHEGGWRISGHPARNLRFHDPGGRIVPTGLSRPRPAVGSRL